MNAHSLPAVASLRYRTAGLEPRDVILLKSLIRLLSHRTRHQWVCGHHDAHLEVIGPLADITPGPPLQETHLPIRLLMAHAPPPEALHFVRLPLHVNELESMLNQLGQHIAQVAALGPPAAPARQAAPALQPAPAYHLRRWPQASLLTSRERLSLATLMTVRPLSLAALQECSGQTAQACEDFLRDLQSAGLLQWATAPLAPAQVFAPDKPAPLIEGRPAPGALTAPMPTGLIARIRRRLGMVLTPRA